MGRSSEKVEDTLSVLGYRRLIYPFYLILDPYTLKPRPQLSEVSHFLSPLGGIPFCHRSRVGGGGHNNVPVWSYAERDMTCSSYLIIPGEEGGGSVGHGGEISDYDDGNGGDGSVGGGGGKTLHLLLAWRTQ